MRKQLMLLVAPLCVVAIAASFAGATPNDPQQTRGPKLDKLHAVRPIAAMSSVLDSSVIRGEVGKQAHTHRQLSRARALKKMPFLGTLEGYAQAADFQNRVGAYVAAAQAVERDQALAAALAAIAANQAQAAVSSGPAYSSSYPGDFLSCVRNRESGGDYHVYNQGGSGAAGAYQFLPGTWSSIAASVGRSDLVGMDPAQASPADQDAMAQALYAQQGSAPWGGYCG
jgi:muramidase (phage lysozyme)